VSTYLVVLDGVSIKPQITEFLKSVQDRIADASFILFIPVSRGEASNETATSAIRFAGSSLETLRNAGLAMKEAILGEDGSESISREFRRLDRSYDCVYRFSSLRRGVYIQRITLPTENQQKRSA
jgi:hypothetical protein